MDRNCSTCVNSDIVMVDMNCDVDHDHEGPTPARICRRNPPQMITIDGSGSTMWPLVLDEDWCAEWKGDPTKLKEERDAQV